MAKLKASGQGMVVCRICKGPHWTKQCPYKDTLGVALDVQQGVLELINHRNFADVLSEFLYIQIFRFSSLSVLKYKEAYANFKFLRYVIIF